MAYFIRPKDFFGEATSVATVLQEIEKWEKAHSPRDRGFQSRVWFRGHSSTSFELMPGIYRTECSARALTIPGAGQPEVKRLALEREMISNFRVAGAHYLPADALVEIYFMAQHHGMPTRLLDWTTNPLTGLFFAANKEGNEDGELIVMDATRHLPRNLPGKSDYPADVLSMRHPYTSDAIRPSFWHDPKMRRPPLILPIRPDNRPGRVGQQSSCFTLHMHLSEPVKNETVARIKVPGKGKRQIIKELHRLNINKFTIFNDLDNLSKEICRSWGLRERQ